MQIQLDYIFCRHNEDMLLFTEHINTMFLNLNIQMQKNGLFQFAETMMHFLRQVLDNNVKALQMMKKQRVCTMLVWWTVCQPPAAVSERSTPSFGKTAASLHKSLSHSLAQQGRRRAPLASSNEPHGDNKNVTRTHTSRAELLSAEARQSAHKVLDGENQRFESLNFSL